MNIRDITTKVPFVRKMTEQDKKEAMTGHTGAQMKWFIEELGEFYDAIERYCRHECNIEDVAEETLGLFHMGQVFPAVEFMLHEHLQDLHTAMRGFNYNDQYYLFREKKLMKGQGQQLSLLGLQNYITIQFKALYSDNTI